MPYLLGSSSSLGPGTGLIEHFDGMGCAGQDCGNCSCSGMGFFDSGAEISGWGILEWATAGLGAYMLLSTIFTTKRAVSSVRSMPAQRRKRKAAAYRKKAAELSKA